MFLQNVNQLLSIFVCIGGEGGELLKGTPLSPRKWGGRGRLGRVVGKRISMGLGRWSGKVFGITITKLLCICLCMGVSEEGREYRGRVSEEGKGEGSIRGGEGGGEYQRRGESSGGEYQRRGRGRGVSEEG